MIRIQSTYFLFAICFGAFSFRSSAQGCSDAGVCTINGLKGEEQDSTPPKSWTLKFGINGGKADHQIAVYGAYFNVVRRWNTKLETDIKITTLGQNGNSVNAFGLSDVYLIHNYTVNSWFKLTGGFKIPLQNSNRTYQGFGLPMDYQSSLGTLDGIIGAVFQVRKLSLVGAWQQPLTQNNNRFLPGNYTNGPLSTFQATNHFSRRGDIIARATYPLNVNRWIFTPGLLGIYHLGQDTYIDSTGISRSISGSQGLTLNANLYVDYKLSRNQKLQMTFGTPFVVREIRPDGLTRSFVLNLEYQVKLQKPVKHVPSHL